MANVAELTAAIMEEAASRGIPMTQEQAAAEAARVSLQPPPAAESRMDGAPEVDLTDLTPQAYTDTLKRRGRQLEMGGPSNPLPGQPGWTEDDDILAYEPGMTDEQYDFERWKRSEGRRMRGLEADGVMHPYQELGYDGPRGFEQWQEEQAIAAEDRSDAEFAAAGASRSTAPGPRGFDNSAAAPREFGTVEESLAYDERKPIQDATGTTVGVLPSERDRDMYPRGMVPVFSDDGTVGYSVAAGAFNPTAANQGDGIVGGFPELQGTRGRLGERPDLEAKGWVPTVVNTPVGAQGGRFGRNGQAVVYRPGEGLQEQLDQRAEDQRFVRLATRAGIPYEDAVEIRRANPDTWEQLFRDKGSFRRATEQAGRRRRASMDDMLAGPNPSQNLGNAFDLIGDQGEFDLTENQRRALEYTMPGGRLAAEVDARNMEEAAGLASRGLQNALLPAIMQGLNPETRTPPPQGRVDVENGANGSWNTPEGIEYLVEMSRGFNSKQDFANFLVNNFGYSPAEAQLAAARGWARWWRSGT